MPSGITLVDDSAKPKETPPSEPPSALGETLSDARESYGNDPDSVLKLLDARLKLREAGVSGMLEPGRRSEAPLEMTPTPMVLDDSEVASRRGRSEAGFGHLKFDRMTPTPPEPLSVRRVREMQRNAGNLSHSLQPVELAADAIVKGGSNDVGRESDNPPVSYHPPRPPPPSIAPPAPAASISVANEYDPRAPTKPKVRRASTLPPAPQLLGLDRMLVWGMVLGGLFVAVVVVLVHKLAPASSRPHADPSLAVDAPPPLGLASSLRASNRQPLGSAASNAAVVGSGAPHALQVPEGAEGGKAAVPSSSAGRSTLPPAKVRAPVARRASSPSPSSSSVTDKVLWIE